MKRKPPIHRKLKRNSCHCSMRKGNKSQPPCLVSPSFTQSFSTSIFHTGRHACECQACRHPLINNCTSCGRIVCGQEGSGPCLFCGQLVSDPCLLLLLEVFHSSLSSGMQQRGTGSAQSWLQEKRAIAQLVDKPRWADEEHRPTHARRLRESACPQGEAA